MDGIKRKLPKVAQVPPIMQAEKMQKQVTPTYSKKEDLYISKQETLYRKPAKKKSNSKVSKIFWLFILLILLTGIAYVSFFLFKTYSVAKKINISNDKKTTLSEDVKSIISPIIPMGEKSSLRGQETGRINILLMGAAGEHKPGGNLTDTIMIMSIDVKNKKIALLSLPRDFYVNVPNSNNLTKINALYKISVDNKLGADLIKQAVEKITNLNINYYTTVDFDAFQKIVDNIGGVNIISERDIYDARYPGPNYSYQTFELSKGAHLLDGKTALQYVRERHDDPEGDFGRAKRQQQVIQAVKNKFFSVQTLFNAIALNNVLDTLGDNIKTDMTFDDLDQFVRLSKDLDTQNINNAVVDAWKPTSLLKVSHVTMGNAQAFILVPRVGNYSEIQDLAKNIFDQKEISKRQDEIKNEDASITIINKSGNADLLTKIKKLLSERLGMKNVKVIANTENETITNSIISTNENGAGKIFTLDELIKKLPAKLTEEKIDNENDITITLGTDLINTYKYEEDSIDDFNKAQDSQDDIDFTKQN
jgi:LCP family protein required for cell wall assembly